MTEEEITGVFGLLGLQTHEEREAVRFEPVQLATSPTIEISFTNHTDTPPPVADFGPSCPPSPKF
jgi:hypothetical protein